MTATAYDTDWYQAHLDLIREHPAADLPRLVLADRLEENGEPERAELIRLQLDPLYRVPCGQTRRPIPDLPDVQAECLSYVHGADDCRPEWCPQCKVRWRVMSLLTPHDADTVKHVEYPFIGNGWTIYAVLQYSRGFVSHVRCPLSWWVGGECGECRHWQGSLRCPRCDGTGRTPANGPRLVREQLVELVTVTDRLPERFLGGPHQGLWFWGHEDNAITGISSLPADIYERLPLSARRRVTFGLIAMYPTRDAADDALSNALLQWAKEVNE